MSRFDTELVIAAVLGGETDRFRLFVREYGLVVRAYLIARLYAQVALEKRTWRQLLEWPPVLEARKYESFASQS